MNFVPCLCTVIDHTEDVRACKEQESYHSTSSRVVLFCSLHAVMSFVIYYMQYTHGKM